MSTTCSTDGAGNWRAATKSGPPDGGRPGAANRQGSQDLNSALIGTQSTIFVGALDRNGSLSRPASLASYSNFAGSDPKVQNQFPVVGVEGHKTGLYGTSFAAPVVSGYSAVLGSKFTRATPTQIVDRLLGTARTDTVANYDMRIHGRGEASISRALASASIR
jgi:subtilisin family serine protease